MSDPVTDLKHELLAAAERQHAPAAVQTGRQLRRLGRKRFLLAVATLAIAASGALFFTAPWSGSPGLLARAQAALTPPAGTILHQKWEMTWTSTDFACTVKHGPNEIWVDQTPPHRYRVLLSDFRLPPDGSIPDARAVACSRGTASEFGGTLDPHETLRFVPPDTLSASPGRFAVPNRFRPRPAPLAQRRQGPPRRQDAARWAHRRAHPPRSAARLFVSPCSQDPGYAYVDPETLYPVEIHGHGVLALPDSTVVWPRVVMRIVTFEYLPRTDANLALTNIRAQHPNATAAG